MTRRILVFLIATLFFVLTGLLVLFFYLRHSGTYHSKAVRYIPPETTFILRVKQTSVNLNMLFENEWIKDNSRFREIASAWKTIDSLTSRNYKTNEILTSTSSYFCIDSAGKLLVLIEMPSHTSAHFIDQFLVNSTRQKKLEKFKEGYKSISTDNGPLYYFLDHDVLGISTEKFFVHNSLAQRSGKQMDTKWASWEQANTSDMAIWMENTVISRGWFGLVPQYVFGGWLDSLGGHGNFQLKLDKNTLRIEGEISADSAAALPARLFAGNPGSNYLPVLNDSAVWQNQYYSYNVTDTNGSQQPLQVCYLGFRDTSGYTELLVSESQVAKSVLYLAFRDSTAQIVPMADPEIEKVVVLKGEILKKLVPVFPFLSDSGSFFGASVKGRVFFTRSMESVLTYTTIYPQGPFKKSNPAQNTVISSVQQVRIAGNTYRLSYQYQMNSPVKFTFSTEIKCVSCN